MDDYQPLVDQYKAQKSGRTERESAQLEKQIWQMALPTLSRNDGSLLSKREFLAKLLSEPTHLIEARSTILGYGDAADLAWERIENEKLPIRTAVRLLRTARERARATGTDMAESLAIILKEYSDLPSVRLPDGKIAHKRNPATLPKPPLDTPPESPKDDDPKLFWANLRGMISGYFHTRLDGMDHGAIEKVWRELDIELKVVLEHFQHKIDRMRRDRDNRKMGVSRGKVIQACHVLNLDPPPSMKPIDAEFRGRAKKQFKKLASVYHPDKSGSDDTRSLYESVVEAYRILEDL